MSTKTGTKRRRVWRWGTVLPAVLTTLAGLGAVGVAAAPDRAPVMRATSFADGSPIGWVDGLYGRQGGVLAVGWDFDPNDRTAPNQTNAWVDGHFVAGVLASVPRPDVAAAYPKAGPNHGYRFFVPVPEGTHRVCIRAANVGAGHSVALGCVERTFDYGPFGSLEQINTTPGHLYVKGWAMDKDALRQPVSVAVVIDNTTTTIVANQFRPDLADSHPYAGGYHGFQASIPMSQGTHNVCVNTINIGYGSNNTFGCRTVTLNDSPVGQLQWTGQTAGQLHVIGWAWDDDAPTQALSVTVKIDGTDEPALTAGIGRAMVSQQYPQAGPYHGYGAAYTLPEGSHTVCVTVHNIGYGSDLAYPCRTVVLNFTPTATVTSLTATATGATITGWASDPDTNSPIPVALTDNGKPLTTVTANLGGGPHSGHVFSAPLTLTSGAHTLCAVAQNVLYGTHNSQPACRPITLALSPLGAFQVLQRVSSTSSNLTVGGWALDPDTTGPISVQITLDGTVYGKVPANTLRTDIGTQYPAYGNYHGFSTVVTADAGEHTVCVTALNVGGGADDNLGCKLIIAVHPVPPSPPTGVAAVAGYGGAEVSWTAPTSDGGAPWTGYTVVSSPGNISVTVAPGQTSATVLGLKPSTAYTFSVTATNVAGTSTAGVSPAVTTQASPPAQTTPAPVSTSRYIRNIYGASSTDLATMRSEGATDAYYNPSGHGYLVLLDIGGQDEYDGGVVLSATTRFVSYANLLADLKAYVDGYHSKQNASAPVTIAIGTNNDMDVSSSSGKSWATKVIGPLAAYARQHYMGIAIAGANDIEPGFRAGYWATKAWLTGYLANTTAPFVFNGSADGCSWTTVSQGCNNGWTMSGLYYLAAGAAPARMLNLPQIYNTTMAAQWKYISLTGVVTGNPRIDFGGPLTEWTACYQTNSCGSLTGHTAWTTMWNNLQSDSRLKVVSLPYSTDLRIDK